MLTPKSDVLPKNDQLSFSIDRLLSIETEDDGSRDELSETITTKRSRKKMRHRNARIPFTPEESLVLETYFSTDQYLDERMTKEIANRLNMKPIRIRIWFQNRRARSKKENGPSKSSSSQVFTPSFCRKESVDLGDDPWLSSSFSPQKSLNLADSPIAWSNMSETTPTWNFPLTPNHYTWLSYKRS